MTRPRKVWWCEADDKYRSVPTENCHWNCKNKCVFGCVNKRCDTTRYKVVRDERKKQLCAAAWKRATRRLTRYASHAPASALIEREM